MHQLSLIPDAEHQLPIARKSDPVTSVAAAQAITASGTREDNTRECLALVRREPGICGSEMPERLRKRLKELEAAGLVRRGEMRESKVSGFSNVTWWPV
jgi:hypothetical protein